MPCPYRPTVLFVLAIMLAGCDSDRISKLEKQNQELMADIKKDHAVADYDLQAKCARDSKAWFNENWRADKDTVLLTYTNHYNKSENKCFILVEYHYSYMQNTWVNDMTLWDLYENSKYGTYSETHISYPKPEYHTDNNVVLCEMLDRKCKTLDEFNNLVRPYLNN